MTIFTYLESWIKQVSAMNGVDMFHISGMGFLFELYISPANSH
jgi:hypothetical protein